MRPQTIRVLDRWVGAPVCWVLTVWRRLGGVLRRRPPEAVPPKRILFIKLVELGANVQAYPALRRAAEVVGRENVFFWVFDENRPILEILDVVPPENLLVVRSGGFVGFAVDMLKTLWRVRRLGIDAVVDMEFFARASAILAYLSGARIRVGLHRFTCEGVYRGNLLTHRVQYNPYTHVSTYYYLLVEAMGASGGEWPMPKRPLPEVQMQPFQFRPGRAEVAELHRMLATAVRERSGGALQAGPIVVLNPNASDIVPVRRWPTERFVELGRRLLERYPEATVVITGSPSEQDAVEELIRQMDSPRAISLAGQTTLRQLIVLYCVSDLLVTNDSGPGQFASMTPIDTVILFGPETPLLWKPLGERVHVLWAGLACSPCVSAMNHRSSPCRDPRCMAEITVGRVLETAERVLTERGFAARGPSTRACGGRSQFSRAPSRSDGRRTWDCPL